MGVFEGAEHGFLLEIAHEITVRILVYQFTVEGVAI